MHAWQNLFLKCAFPGLNDCTHFDETPDTSAPQHRSLSVGDGRQEVIMSGGADAPTGTSRRLSSWSGCRRLGTSCIGAGPMAVGPRLLSSHMTSTPPSSSMESSGGGNIEEVIALRCGAARSCRK